MSIKPDDLGGRDFDPDPTDAMGMDELISDIDELTYAIISVLGQFDKDRLREIAAERERVRPDGWMQRMILEYLDVWG